MRGCPLAGQYGVPPLGLPRAVSSPAGVPRLLTRGGEAPRRALTPLPQIARELGVDAIVAGSVATAGDDVRVTAQLIRGSSDAVLLAETYQRDFRDVLTLQS